MQKADAAYFCSVIKTKTKLLKSTIFAALTNTHEQHVYISLLGKHAVRVPIRCFMLTQQ